MPAFLLGPACKKEKSAPSGGAGGGDTKVLRFSAIPDENTTEQTAKFQKFADYLSKTLGVKSEFIPAIDYDASVSKFANGEIHLAWFGGLTGVQARSEVDGARAIAQGAEDPHDISHFIAPPAPRRLFNGRVPNRNPSGPWAGNPARNSRPGSPHRDSNR